MKAKIGRAALGTTACNPDRVRAQMEGAAIMAISNALYSNISAKEGRIEQGNFDAIR
jgi:CO/xanthine dehydrogenase Mo-binding subunit